jgi:hypothetical protein
MKLIFKAIGLFFFGVWVDMNKAIFDRALQSRIKKELPLSDPALVRKSKKCYDLYVKFQAAEMELSLSFLEGLKER